MIQLLFQRAFARFLDYNVTALIAFATVYITKSEFSFRMPAYMVLSVLWIFSYLFYVPACHYLWGCTLGKLILRLRVVTVANTSLSLTSALVREILWIPHFALPAYHEAFVLFLIYSGVITNPTGTHAVFLTYHPHYSQATSVTLWYDILFAIISLFVAWRSQDGRTPHDLLARTKVIPASLAKTFSGA